MSRTLSEFADNFLLALMIEAPDVAANLGLRTVAGQTLDPAHMPDFSAEGSERRRLLMGQYARAFMALKGTARTEAERVTEAVLDHVFEVGIYSVFPGHMGAGFLDQPYPVTHLTGVHATLTMLLARDHAIGTPDHAEAFVVRLGAMVQALDSAVNLLRERAGSDVFAPAFTVRKTLDDIALFMAEGVSANLLARAFVAGAERTKLDRDFVDRKTAAVETILSEQVYPAYERLRLELQKHLRHAGEDHGAWSLPDGDAYYAWRLQAYTTTTTLPDEVHRIGIEETARIQARILELASSLGVRGGDMKSVFGKLERCGHHHAPRDVPALLGHMRNIVSRGHTEFRPLFGSRWPAARVVIEPVPDALAGSMHSHYIPAGKGEDRPATFYANMGHMSAMNGGDLDIACYHEVFPGHHVQLSVAQESTDLCDFRRATLFAGYLEGWAKYAETLAERFYLLNDSYIELARLKSELYSTVNLVVDTGIHWKRWTRARARAYFQAQTAAPDVLADMVVDRSMVMPGQLCAYKIGMMRMQSLWGRFSAAKGGDSAVCAFHDLVLGLGAVPLDVLDAEVDRVLRAA